MIYISSFSPVPRKSNQRSWLYRLRPSACHRPFSPYEGNPLFGHGWDEARGPNPNQLRWRPFQMPEEGTEVDFVDGMRTVAGAGDARVRAGIAVHVYACNAPMADRCERFI